VSHWYMCVFWKYLKSPKLDKLKTANIFQNSLTYNHFNGYNHKTCYLVTELALNLFPFINTFHELTGKGHGWTDRETIIHSDTFPLFFVFPLCLRWCASVELTVSFMGRHENWSNDPAYPAKYKAISVIGLFSQLLTDSVLIWSLTFNP